MAFGEKSDRIEDLEGQLARERDANVELRERLATAQAVINTGPAIVQELAREVDGEVDVSPTVDTAITIARIAVTSAERERLTTEMAEKLKKDKHDVFAAEVRTKEGPAIRDALDTTFRSDGTYDTIEEEVAAEIRAEIQAELLEERRAAETTRLQNPEVKAAQVAEMALELATNGTLDEFTSEVKLRLHETWLSEALEVAKAQTTSEIEYTEEAFKAELTPSLLRSYDVRLHREREQERLQKLWQQATLHDLLSAVTTEEERKVIQVRIDAISAENEQQRLEAEAANRLNLFEGKGIDTTQLEDGSRMTVYLGEVQEFEIEKRQRDEHGFMNNTTVNEPGMLVRRSLELRALGGGRFMVDTDSLALSRSVYARGSALPAGMVITVGTTLTENGEALYEQKLRADAELHFDDDTRDPEVRTALLPIVNVKIDGIMARAFDHVKQELD